DGRVSEEMARAAGGDESIVVGRGGWLRLPEELLRRSGIRTHAMARLEGRDIVVSATTREDDIEQDMAPMVDEPRDTTVGAETRGLRKVYGAGATARAAVDGLDAGFRSSSVTAVTGPSGSGKTTLLQLLAGLELPTDGEVLALGTDIASLDRSARARFRRDHIGYVGQETALVPSLSALENVELALALRGLPADGARETLGAGGRRGPGARAWCA